MRPVVRDLAVLALYSIVVLVFLLGVIALT